MNEKSAVWQIKNDMKLEPVGEGVSHRIMGYDDNLMMVEVVFETGSTGAMHSHRHSQATYVVKGKFEVTIGEEKMLLGAGDGYYVAPDVTHGCVCLEEGVLIDTFSPMREDFLN